GWHLSRAQRALPAVEQRRRPRHRDAPRIALAGDCRVTLLAPLALAFGVSLPILLVFYLLKVRRTPRQVSSTLLWETLRRDLAAHEPWQRLHWSVLLIVQMILLAVLTGALARPSVQVPAPTSRFVALIVDTSASMRATDVVPSRFEQARSAARETIDRLPDG